ncbi:enoyl-CoA hydratase/isomerase family protein [Rhodococcus sp. NPDC019627]|uniref:Probable enoyl-CoA hydratase EchA17 n=2 Tax=Rhodococcus TaxID=1827 RepID=C1BDU6_RHOOB|nr:enoyl-CoA hydratase [Rhodococcus opacus B4]
MTTEQGESPPITHDDQFVYTEMTTDRVAIVRLERPRANALSLAVLRQLDEAFQALASDLPGAVVIWGGPRIFAAGGDISEMGGPEDAARFVKAFRSTFDRIASIPRPVIAAVCGYALGGGLELALSADLRVAGEGAKFGLPEVNLGLVPGAGGTQRLSRLVGPSRAKDLVMTGRQVNAEEALRIGIADRVVPDDEVFSESIALARRLATGPSVALATAKSLIDANFDQPLNAGLDAEGRAAVAMHHTEDGRAGVKSFIANGPGQAKFVGR